jgi:hypothetical protein
MRLDRVYSEGEAQVALQRMGFDVHPAPMRPGLYEIAHPALGGERTCTVDQMCFFAEGASAAEQLVRQGAARQV